MAKDAEPATQHAHAARNRTRSGDPRRETFAKLIALGTMTKAEAARKAGYAQSSARVAGHRLTRDNSVNIMVEDYRAKAEAKAIRTQATYIERLDTLGRKAEDAQAWSPAIKAEELIAKSLGFAEKPSGNSTLEALGAAAALDRIRELMARNPELATIAVDVVETSVLPTPEKVKGKKVND